MMKKYLSEDQFNAYMELAEEGNEAGKKFLEAIKNVVAMQGKCIKQGITLSPEQESEMESFQDEFTEITNELNDLGVI